MKILNLNNKAKLQNKFLNSILKIKFLENNLDICDLLFNGSSIFNNPDDYRHIISLSFTQILLKYDYIKTTNNFKKILLDILSKFNLYEMLNTLNDLNKKLFTNYETINFFFDLLMENFENLKFLIYYINRKLFNYLIDIEQYNKEQLLLLLNKESFRQIVFKIIFFILNGEEKYNDNNLSNCFELLMKIKILLLEIKEKKFSIDIFKLFYMELFKSTFENDISSKYKFLNECKDFSNFTRLKIKPLNSNLFKYLTYFLSVFTSLEPYTEIINCFFNYFNNIFYSFYQISLLESRSFWNNEIKIKDNEKKFYLCNFFHVFQSKEIMHNFYLYLIKYSKNSNTTIFSNFPDLMGALMNEFHMCHSPFYFDVIYESLKDIDQYKKNELYINELIEMIIKIDLIGGNNVYEFDEVVNNKYRNFFYNLIELMKMFYSISKKEVFKCYKLKEYSLQLLAKIKKNLFIYSRHLISFDDYNIKIKKTLLEICANIFISFINIENSTEEHTNINDKIYQLFLNDNYEQNNNNIGKSIFFIFDALNTLLNYKKIKNINADNYLQVDLQYYFYEIKSEKEDKSLLILLINKLKMISFNPDNKRFSSNKDSQKLIDKFFDLLIEDLLLLINNSSGFKKTKNDSYYDSIIDSINDLKKSSKKMQKESLISLFEEIVNKGISNKKLNIADENLELIKNEKNEIKPCLLRNNCLILNDKNYDMSFEDIPNIKEKAVINSYFDIEIKNVVKTFKKDILLKDCSIYFADIYYNDKNFKKIKKAFFCKYKKNLTNDNNIELLNYPSKLKNFSSNKYAAPKMFLKCNTNLYNYTNFSILYPKINEKLLKKKSFPLVSNNYDIYNDLLENNNDNLVLNSFNSELISIKCIIFGTLALYEKYILFKNNDSIEEYKTSIEFIYSSGEEAVLNKKIIIILYDEIEEIFQRTFAYNKQAIEIFLKNGKSYLINLLEYYNLFEFYKTIEKIKINQKFDFNVINDTHSTFEKMGYTKQWENNEINNFQYLLYLNKYSGRSYNDINQYPIFPWITLTKSFLEDSDNDIIKNEDNPEINKSEVIFRNMKYFMMAQTKEDRESAIASYKGKDEENKYQKHFRFHYSTGGYILFYLMRISPFMESHIKFQGNKFDNPNRQLNVIDEKLFIMKCSKDSRELIPEFFTTLEYFCNLNYVFFGLNQNKELVNNIHSPSFYSSIGEYIYYNRLLLNNRIKNKDKDKNNSSFQICKIYRWINLVFGYLQYPHSSQGLNKFGKYSYRQYVSLTDSFKKYKTKKLKKSEIMQKIKTKKLRILNFGECPEQLFLSKHNKYKKEHFHYNFQSSKVFDISDNNNNIKIITFWLDESHTNYYFLTKNTNNKKMCILIYDEKFNKKYDVFIDKIKLFNCKNDFKQKEKEKLEKESINKSFISKMKFSMREEIKRLKTYLSFELIEDNNIEDNYIESDLSKLYILNPRDAIMDICDYNNIYFFVGRNKDNSMKIYTQNINNGKLFGLIKTRSFISVINKKDNDSFFTGHSNGKLIEWQIKYKDRHNLKINSYKNGEKKIYLSDITLKREIIAHNFCLITSIHYNERHNIILSSDVKGFLYIRKYYDFEFLTQIRINNNDFCFVNKIFVNNYDLIYTINYNSVKFRNYICLYSINGILLEQSKNSCCIDSAILKNGKIIFNILNKDFLFIFGFNQNKSEDKKYGEIINDDVLKNLDIKIDTNNIMNFFIENNNIYILLKNGKFIKGIYGQLETLSYGEDKFSSKN